jgi:hypothetical protein
MSESQNNQGQTPGRGGGRLGPGEVPPPPPWRVEGAPPGTPGSNEQKPKGPALRRPPFGSWWKLAAATLLLWSIVTFGFLSVSGPRPVTIDFTFHAQAPL